MQVTLSASALARGLLAAVTSVGRLLKLKHKKYISIESGGCVFDSGHLHNGKDRTCFAFLCYWVVYSV